MLFFSIVLKEALPLSQRSGHLHSPLPIVNRFLTVIGRFSKEKYLTFKLCFRKSSGGFSSSLSPQGGSVESPHLSSSMPSTSSENVKETPPEKITTDSQNEALRIPEIKEPLEKIAEETSDIGIDVTAPIALGADAKIKPLPDSGVAPQVALIDVPPAMQSDSAPAVSQENTTENIATLMPSTHVSNVLSETGSKEPWKKVISERAEGYQDVDDDDEVEEVPIDRSPGIYFSNHFLSTKTKSDFQMIGF